MLTLFAVAKPDLAVRRKITGVQDVTFSPEADRARLLFAGTFLHLGQIHNRRLSVLSGPLLFGLKKVQHHDIFYLIS